MKLNKLMAAALVALTGVANATLAMPNGGDGSLLLLAFDASGSPVSMAVDLGLSVNDFRGYDLEAGTFNANAGLSVGYHKIVWDFSTNTVTAATPDNAVTTFNREDGTAVQTTTGAVVAGINPDIAWSAINAQFKSVAQASDVRFAVIAADTGTNFYLTTGNNPTALNNLSNGSASNFALTDQGLYQATTQQGTHATNENGANVVFGTAQPSLINSAIWGAADGWVTNSNFGANSAAGVTQNNFFTLDNNNSVRTVVVGDAGGPIGNAAALLGNTATWTYDFVNSTLTYETALVTAVPEPSTYALMGLGLVGIALMARRRQA